MIWRRFVAFFEARNGRLHGFRFKDWADYKSCLPSQTITPSTSRSAPERDHHRVPAVEALYVGRADMGPDDCASRRRHSAHRAGPDRTDLRLDARCCNWRGDLRHGTANGVIVRAGFQFDVPVRFDTDLLDVTLDIERLGSITSIR